MAELYADRGLSQVCDAYTKRAAELGDADLARAIARNLIRTARTGNPCWQTIADSLAVLLSRMGVSGGDAGSALLAAAMAAGHIAEEAGRPQPAFAFYRQAIEIGGDTIATAWSGAGRCASQLGDREVAIECFRTADKTAWDMGLYRNYDGFYDLGLPGLGTDGLGSIEPCFGPKTQLLKLYLAQGDWERFLVTAVPLIRSNVTQFGGATQVMQIPFYERIIPQLWNDGQHEVLAKLAGELLQVAPDDGLRSQLSLLQDLCAQKMRVPRSAA
jgi:tetratricopeptide (TPR) repeat protein